MSTNSVIAIKENNSFKCISCHWDGYISHNGRILQEYYQDIEKVKLLVGLGDISALGKEVEPTDFEHSFDYPELGVTIAYCRDRGEEFRSVAPMICSSLKDVNSKYCITYIYYYNTEDSNWYISLCGNEPRLLSDALLEESEEK